MKSKIIQAVIYIKDNKSFNQRKKLFSVTTRFLSTLFIALLILINLLDITSRFNEGGHFHINMMPPLEVAAAAPEDKLLATGWVSQTVDGVGEIRAYTSFALDTNDLPHISYFTKINTTNYLIYARWTSVTGWITQTVDRLGGSGTFSSLAVDDNGNPHISYHDFNSGSDDLKYAWWEEGFGWHKEYVDTVGRVGKYNSLALDQAKNPHITYYDETNGSLKYAVRSPNSGWTYETIDNAGWHTSLVLDQNEIPHVSYYSISNVDLKYATRNITEGWVTQTVTSTGNIGSYTSIALDQYGNPRISYHDVGAGALMYASWSPETGWTTELVDDEDYVGWNTSLSLDSADNPHISYYEITKGLVKYAYWTAVTGWVTQIVEPDGTVSSLALDSDDNPHISYFYGSNHSINYAWLDRLPLADSGGDYSVEEGSQIILDGSRSYPYDNPVYEWDFDYDGTTFDVDAVGATPLFDASNLDGPDQVTIALRVKDSDNFTDVHSSTITVTNAIPTVTILGENKTYYTGIPVSFSAIYTDSGVLDTHSITWDFGDGSQITNTLTPVHTFLSKGNFTVTLEVLDDDNGIGKDMVTVNIKEHQIYLPAIMHKTD